MLPLNYGHDLTLYEFHIADKEILFLHSKVDLVVTLGGDGTVLWVCAFTLIFAFFDESECIMT